MVFAGTKAEANELALNAVLKQECQVRLYVYRRCTQDSHTLHPRIDILSLEMRLTI